MKPSARPRLCPRSTGSLVARLWPWLIALQLLAVPALADAAPQAAADPALDARAGPWEHAAVVPAQDLLGDLPLAGEGYRIREQASIVHYYGRFLVDTDLGLFAVDGSDLLRQRLAELPAARALAAASGGAVMGSTAGDRLRRPFEQGAQVVSEPGETLRRLPAGVGRFLSRTARRVQKLAWRIGDAASDGINRDNADEVAATPESSSTRLQKVRDFGLDYIGYDRARRELARRLGVDPYTSHPLISQRLDELAWSAWVGRQGASLLLGGVVGESLDTALDISGDAYELAWSANPLDIEKLNEERLAALGLRGRPVRDFLRNGAFNPLLQTAFVERLGESAFSTLRLDLLQLAAELESEREVRFLLAQLAELAAAGRLGDGLPRVGLVGTTLVLDQGDGRLSVVLPVDWLLWDETTAAFALRSDLRDYRPRLLLTGRASAVARDAFVAAGWELQEQWSALASERR